MMSYCSSGFRSLFLAGLYLAAAASSQSLQAEETNATSEKDHPVTAEQRAFVQNKVLPLLEARCFECHGGAEGEEPEGALVLTSLPTALKGGDSGAAIVPGKPDESLLVEAIRYESFEMPPRSKMPEPEIQILVDWIEMGAPWPADLQDSNAASAIPADFPLEERRASHWSWQPIKDPLPPTVTNKSWPLDAVDQFVLAGLEEAGLSPAPKADRRILIRRLFFDLIGLPPSVEDVNSYVNDSADDQAATAAVIDRLLDSPQFGERWARHWLDLVRYAETLGHEFDYPLRHAWQYRDYVIRAFNADVPYDDFVLEHVAGDLLKEPRRHPTEGFNEAIIGTGFWHLHEDKHAPVDVMAEQAIKVDNQIDVFSRTFMGLTVACARCHDHKFDAIPTKDYYALYGILQSSRRRTGWLDRKQSVKAATDAMIALQDEAAALTARLRRADTQQGVIATYAEAAITAVQQLAGDSAQQESVVRDVATRESCDPALLDRWVTALRQPETSDLSNPLSLIAGLANAAKGDDPSAVVQQWTDDVVEVQADDRQTVLFADFSRGLPNGWSTTGPAFSTRSERLDVGVGAAGARLGTAGLSSAELSPRFRGSLYSPTFELTHPEVLIRIAGENVRARLVIDGYVMMEFNALLFKGLEEKVDTKGEFQWIRLAKDTHRYMGRSAYLEIMDEGDGWFVVDEVRFATDRNGAPPKTDVPSYQLQLAQALNDSPTPGMVAEAAERLLWPALFSDGLLPSSVNADWIAITTQAEQLSADAPRPFPVIAMVEGTGRDQSVFIRGNHKNPGAVASRAFLTAVSGTDQTPVKSGSGRLELAGRLLAEDNPFPARVAVNRIWHHLFGRGIVATTDDFGVLGTRPSHPELLDYLAGEFRRNGWSMKQMIRRLMLTQTYQMQSTPSARATEVDPANVLLQHARIRRLQGEAIRDTMLEIAGHLDPQMFGPPVPVALTPFMEGRGRPKGGPLDGNGRRSIYISVNRNFLSPFMLAFDTPAPMSTRGRRSVSNVPAQALIMLNDEYAHQQAQRWADRLLNQKKDVASTVSLAYEEALGRQPTPQELAAINAFAHQQAEQHDEQFVDGDIGRKTFQDVCHAIMNTKEFIYIR